MKSIIAIGILVLLFGCVSTQKVCPPEDVIINSGYGPIKIPKGMMNPDGYYTIPEWEALVEEYYDSLKVPKEGL